MPYQFQDNPSGARTSVRKHDRVLDRCFNAVILPTDNGVNAGNGKAAGWPLPMKLLPSWVEYPRKKSQDFIYTRWHSVSAKMRDIIERLEPAQHQFQAVEFRLKETVETRFWWNVVGRLDTVDPDRSTFEFAEIGETGSFRYEYKSRCQARLVFDSRKIGARHFWVDKHLLGHGWWMSLAAHRAFVGNRLTGLSYTRYPE